MSIILFRVIRESWYYILIVFSDKHSDYVHAVMSYYMLIFQEMYFMIYVSHGITYDELNAVYRGFFQWLCILKKKSVVIKYLYHHGSRPGIGKKTP